MRIDNWEIERLESFQGGARNFAKLKSYLQDFGINIVVPEPEIAQQILNEYLRAEPFIWLVEEGGFVSGSDLRYTCNTGYFGIYQDHLKIHDGLPGRKSNQFFIEFPRFRSRYLELNFACPEDWKIENTEQGTGILLPKKLHKTIFNCQDSCCTLSSKGNE